MLKNLVNIKIFDIHILHRSINDQLLKNITYLHNQKHTLRVFPSIHIYKFFHNLPCIVEKILSQMIEQRLQEKNEMSKQVNSDL